MSHDPKPDAPEVVVLDLDDPYFHGQSLPEALADYSHVHSTTGVCVKGVHCHGCGRVLAEGESAWAADWTVIAAEGTRTEIRYTCDACHEFDERTAMPATFTCLGCGRITPDDDNGCLTCDLCEGCTPAAGNCLDCADMRRGDVADQARRYAIENEVCS